MLNSLFNLSFFIIILAGLQSCNKKGDDFFEIKEGVELCSDPLDTSLICNPMGKCDDENVGRDIPSIDKSRLGLLASLYEGNSAFVNIDTYLNQGVKHPTNLYFCNFNVPSQSFDEGFLVGSDAIKTVSGEKLTEWFSIEAKGHLLLPQNEESGFFHLATLSDDGIRVKVGGEVIINNDSFHAPSTDCGYKLIELKKGEEKKFELNYFQGPRHQIALVTLIKRVDPASFSPSSQCSGSSLELLLADGYEIIGPSWFTLPY